MCVRVCVRWCVLHDVLRSAIGYANMLMVRLIIDMTADRGSCTCYLYQLHFCIFIADFTDIYRDDPRFLICPMHPWTRYIDIFCFLTYPTLLFYHFRIRLIF